MLEMFPRIAFQTVGEPQHMGAARKFVVAIHCDKVAGDEVSQVEPSVVRAAIAASSNTVADTPRGSASALGQ